MILVDVILWLWEHWKSISLMAVIGYAVKVGLPILLKKYRLDRDEDRIQWAIERVEKLTGETYIGPTEKSWKTVRKNSKVLLRLLPGITNRGNLLRRAKRMIDKKWLLSLLITAAGLVKTKTGIEIPDELVNNVVDWIWLGGVIGIAIWNMRKPAERPHPFDNVPQRLPFDGTKSS